MAFGDSRLIPVNDSNKWLKFAKYPFYFSKYEQDIKMPEGGGCTYSY